MRDNVVCCCLLIIVISEQRTKEGLAPMIKLRSKNTALIILMVNIFIAMIGIGLIVPVLPMFMQEFGASGTALGYLVAATGLTHFLFSPLAGELSDRYGRKMIIVSGIGMFTVSQLVFALAQDLWLLYISRLIGGVGIAFMIPPIMAYVADITTEEDRCKSLGWVGAAMSLGFVIGPGIGGFLAEYGVRFPFYAASAVAAFSMVLSMLLLPETLSQKGQLTNIYRQFILSFKASYFGLLLLTFTLTFGLASFDAVFGLYLTVKYGFTPQNIAVLITVGSLMSVIVQALLIDLLLQYFKEKTLINGCLLSCIVTLILMLFSGDFGHVLILILLFFSFIAILRLSINTLLSKMAEHEQGFVAGTNNAYMGLGNIAGPSIAGILFDIHIDLPYVFGACIILVSLLLSVLGEGKGKLTYPSTQ